jgi:hypothetical protein
MTSTGGRGVPLLRLCRSSDGGCGWALDLGGGGIHHPPRRCERLESHNRGLRIRNLQQPARLQLRTALHLLQGGAMRSYDIYKRAQLVQGRPRLANESVHLITRGIELSPWHGENVLHPEKFVRHESRTRGRNRAPKRIRAYRFFESLETDETERSKQIVVFPPRLP